MHKSLLVYLLFLLPFLSAAQTVCTLESRERLEEILSQLAQEDLSEKSSNELVIAIGKKFLETPYVEKTLELPGEEKLVINLTGLDCTTFVETVITLTRIAEASELSFEAFEKELENLRYRDGVNQGYPSRLHYFSDWIYKNEQKGIIKNITAEIGGSSYTNSPSFMSENPKFYAQLSEAKNLQAIKSTDAEIRDRVYFYIPQAEITRLEKHIQSGDIIAITTSMTNLDIVHTGFAIEKNGRIHLMHASSKNGEVELSELPLADYLKANKAQSGIMVSRLVKIGI